MLTRLVIMLEPDERKALQYISEQECRLPRDQIRFLLRQEAQQRGLLSNEQTADESKLQNPGYNVIPHIG